MDKTYYSGEEHVFYTNSSTSDNKVYIRPKRGQELIFEGTVAGGGGLPGEPDRSVQFNNGGVFDGDGEFTYNPEDEILTVTKVLVNDSLVAGTILGAESVSDGVFNTSAGVVTFAEITDVSNDVCCRSLFDSANNPIKIDASVPNIGDVLVFKGLSEAKWEPVSVDGITINNATINDSILNSPVLKHDVTSEELDQEIAQAKSFCLWSNLTDAPSQGTSCGMGLTNDLSTYRVVSGCPNYLGPVTPSLGGCAVFSSTNGGVSFVNDVLLKNTSVTLQANFGQNSAISSTAGLISFGDAALNPTVYLYQLVGSTWTFRFLVSGGISSKPSILKFVVGGTFGLVNIYQTADFITWTLQQNISRTYGASITMVDMVGGEMVCYVCPENNVVHIYNSGGGGTFLYTGMFGPFANDGAIISMCTSGEYTVFCTSNRLYIIKRTGITSHAFLQSIAVPNCKNCVMPANGQTRISVTTTTDIITFNRDPLSQEFIQASVLDLGPTMTNPKLCAAGDLVGVGSTQHVSNGGVRVYDFIPLTGNIYVDNEINFDPYSTMYSLYGNVIRGDTIVRDGNLTVENGKLFTFPQSGLTSIISVGNQSLTTGVYTNLNNQLWGVSSATRIINYRIVPSANMSSFTVMESGVYSLSINIGVAASGTGTRHVRIRRNSDYIAYNSKGALPSLDSHIATYTTVMLVVGDLISFEAMQTSGGSLTTTFGNLSINKIANV